MLHVSVDHGFRSSSVGLFWLMRSHEIVVKMLARAAVLWLDLRTAREPSSEWSLTGLAGWCWLLAGGFSSFLWGQPHDSWSVFTT